MKRSPLERKTPLARGKGLARKTPLKQTVSLAKKGNALARRNPLRAKPKPTREPAEARAARLWWEAVTGKGKMPCAKCGSAWRIQGHHVIAKQELKRWARAHGVNPSDLLWDPDCGMPLCEPCHDNHERAHERVPRHLVPPKAVAFAHRLGLDYVIERNYPESV